MILNRQRCFICNGSVAERCHIKTKGSGGGDEDWNILTMCRIHHQEQHTLGFYRFAMKHPVVMKELNRKGWMFEDRFGFMKLVRK